MIFPEDSIQLGFPSQPPQHSGRDPPQLALAFPAYSPQGTPLKFVVPTFCMVAYKTEYVYSDEFINSHQFFHESDAYFFGGPKSLA